MTDLALPPQYLQDKLYTARQDRGLIADIYRQGVRGANELAVTATGVGRGIQVAAGVAYVPGTKYGTDVQGTYRVVSSVPIGFTLDSASTYPRIDRIIIRVYDGRENNTSNDNRGTIEVLKGVEANGATLDNSLGAQSLPFDCLLLAEVVVATGAGVVLSGTDIRDYRVSSTFNSPLFDALKVPYASARNDGVIDSNDGKTTYTVISSTSIQVNIAAGKAWMTNVSGERIFVTFSAYANTFTTAGQLIAVYLSLPTGATHGSRANIGISTVSSGGGLPTIPAGTMLLAYVFNASPVQFAARMCRFANPIGFGRIQRSSGPYALPAGYSTGTGGATSNPLAVDGSLSGGISFDPAWPRHLIITAPGRYLITASVTLTESMYSKTGDFKMGINNINGSAGALFSIKGGVDQDTISCSFILNFSGFSGDIWFDCTNATTGAMNISDEHLAITEL